MFPYILIVFWSQCDSVFCRFFFVIINLKLLEYQSPFYSLLSVVNLMIIVRISPSLLFNTSVCKVPSFTSRILVEPSRNLSPSCQYLLRLSIICLASFYYSFDFLYNSVNWLFFCQHSIPCLFLYLYIASNNCINCDIVTCYFTHSLAHTAIIILYIYLYIY
jgi:hypothetical protein